MFEETFFVSETMENILIGMTFLKKYSKTLVISKHLVHFKDYSLQLKNAKGKNKYKMRIRRSSENGGNPTLQIMIPMCTKEEKITSQSTLEATPSVTRELPELLTPNIVTLKNNKTVIQITNPTERNYTTNPGAKLATFTVLTPNHTKNIEAMPVEQLSLIKQFPEEAPQMIDQLLHEPTCNDDIRLHPTPSTCTDPDSLNPLERQIYDAIVKLRAQKKLDPITSDEQRQTFFSRFNWDHSQLGGNEW